MSTQLEREAWQARTGHRRNAVLLLKGFMTKAYAPSYLNDVVETWQRAKTRPGKLHSLWGCILDEHQLKLTALEALSWVVSFIPAEGAGVRDGSVNRYVIARMLGKHCEYSLWLSHPVVRCKARNLLNQIKLQCGANLGIREMQKRLTASNMHLPLVMKDLRSRDSEALGLLFLHHILPLGILEEVSIYDPLKNRAHKGIKFTDHFFSYLTRFKSEKPIPRHCPMMVSPRPWSNGGDGGYLEIESYLTPRPFAETLADAPRVLDAVNRLQAQELWLDEAQINLARTMWIQGYAIGDLPLREPMREPVQEHFSDMAQYWKVRQAYRTDQRRGPERLRFTRSVALAEKLIADKEPLFYVHHIDHRGRIYPRGGPFSYASGELYRSWFWGPEDVPVAPFVDRLIDAIAEYGGCTGKHHADRTLWFEQNRERVLRVGKDPYDSITGWSDAKSPFRFAQACGEYWEFHQDPQYCTRILLGLDQTTSGFGHVACLLGDTDLARMSNVIGDEPADVYSIVAERAAGICAERAMDREGRAGEIYAWWLSNNNWPDRALFKKAVMPVIYGRTYQSVYNLVLEWTSAYLGKYQDESYPAHILSRALTQAIYYGAKEVLPQIKVLSAWMRWYVNCWDAAGLDAKWITPNGMVVWREHYNTELETYSLPVSGRTMQLSCRERGERKRPHTTGGHIADFVHSFDAALCQNVVLAAGARPILSIHDCWLVGLDSVGWLHDTACQEMKKLYAVDRLTEQELYLEDVLGAQKTESPRLARDLDVVRIGENSHLFD